MTPEFRVWDKLTQKYWNIENWHFEDEYLDLIESGVSIADPNIERVWRKFNEVELMQYTGMKDVNGNKIFEGDILKLSYDDPKTYLYTDEYDCNPKIIPPKTVTRTVKVINEKGAFRVIALHIKLYGARLLCDVDQGRENIEIIGNIHENPELLEVDR
ncbi:YopX family protein [Lactobacillus acetotolerans]|uniref:YopX family protein n=1 Tax=Lactobacillus acetotolerans TaxID=1600 RepID=UPI002FD8D789